MIQQSICLVKLRKQEKIVRQMKTMQDLGNAENMAEEWEMIYKSIDQSLPTALINKEELEDKITILKTKIHGERAELERVIEENSKIDKHNTRVGIIQEQTEDFESELEETTDKIIVEEERNTYLEDP